MNPSARIVCTLHDVLSQRFSRSRDRATTPLRRLRWAWAAMLARRLEQALMRRADEVVVLSEKDRGLLPPGRARVHVVNPPLAPDEPPSGRTPEPGTMLFVAALYRWDNAEGLAWFITECLPLIKRRVPSAKLRVAGAGAGLELRSLAAAQGVELLDFVEDLAPLYAQAAVVVVPLLHGAGTKFKVIDALVTGVPVVTTSVGAEGIGTELHYAGVMDQAVEFAERVVDVLENSVHFEQRAREAQNWAMAHYGREQFLASMERIYAMGEQRA
ncbi:glycosyltransferase family 4 protein [Sinomonas sp. ASV486]|uniref:glycosyltransferase family 4 protein n=1 Tax=Sinomonas sp. ASV486 TaxID=3051170 RepID=UPI0027DB0969|nr:glycosyltransferase family 4 protein [Sinomonas sp. ASV486]MDQ4488834.1 glycosyltransferase family 4 protein [Sinomonas sp. ASV486]